MIEITNFDGGMEQAAYDEECSCGVCTLCCSIPSTKSWDEYSIELDDWY